MTAQWEPQLTSINNKETNYKSLMGPMANTLHQLITQVDTSVFQPLKGKGQNTTIK
ncbi:hypothetical protein [Spartinivicinus poritis]|uniref:Uncharacterized protein n=1 Tax=Spartinivicinus poritis TaxID=2994640 RepID=A0ABT5U705_9GAMM|nr:hypothetical protein [Spartinivicinus sp. A2-2]MDE1462140.1 hypothetical protein [Spartinivicinus sp. A2-2]